MFAIVSAEYFTVDAYNGAADYSNHADGIFGVRVDVSADSYIFCFVYGSVDTLRASIERGVREHHRYNLNRCSPFR